MYPASSINAAAAAAAAVAVAARHPVYRFFFYSLFMKTIEGNVKQVALEKEVTRKVLKEALRMTSSFFSLHI